MRHFDPKGLWDELLQAFRGWWEDDDEATEADPSLAYHLMFTVPVVIGLLTLVKRS